MASLCPRHLAEVPVPTEAGIEETLRSIEAIFDRPVYGSVIPGDGLRYR